MFEVAEAYNIDMDEFMNEVERIEKDEQLMAAIEKKMKDVTIEQLDRETRSFLEESKKQRRHENQICAIAEEESKNEASVLPSLRVQRPRFYHYDLDSDERAQSQDSEKPELSKD